MGSPKIRPGIILALLLALSCVPVWLAGPGRDGGPAPSADGGARGAAPARIRHASPGPDEVTRTRVSAAYGQLPLSFEAYRQGPSDGEPKFLARGEGYQLLLTPTEAVFALRRPEGGSRQDETASRLAGSSAAGASGGARTGSGAVVRMRLAGANPEPKVAGRPRPAGRVNYFVGDDPRRWRTNVETYDTVRYEGVYPGIDLVYYGTRRLVEYDFHVAPGADPSSIRLDFEGADGMRIDGRGELVLETKAGELRQHAPLIYQEGEGGRRTVEGRYVRRGPRAVGFELAAYDKSRPLVIDPVLSFATYLGGSGLDVVLGIAVDAAGNVYVTGSTESLDFPTQSPLQANIASTTPETSDVFVTKLDPTGQSLVYSTYLGGASFEQGADIAVDASGHAYVIGSTSSDNFPTAGPAAARGGDGDVFVAKLNPAGNALVYSTYLGGSDDDAGAGIAVDASGAAYLAGQTNSNNFPTVNPIQGPCVCSTIFDGFVAKLDPAGSQLLYSTYLGGRGVDAASDIAIDASGSAYVTGSTSPRTSRPKAPSRGRCAA